MSKIVSLYSDDFYKNKSNNCFHQAMIEVSKENYSEALVLFEQAYKFNPENKDAYFYVGLIAYIQNDYKMAIEIFKELAEKYPESDEYIYRYARGLYEQECYAESIENFQKISEENEFYYPSRLYYAKALHQEKQFGESANLLISLLTTFPEDAEVRFELASIYAEIKKYSASIAELELCIEQNDEYVLAYYLLHDIYVELGEIEKAIAILENLKEKCPLEEEIVESSIRRLEAKK